MATQHPDDATGLDGSDDRPSAVSAVSQSGLQVKNSLAGKWITALGVNRVRDTKNGRGQSPTASAASLASVTLTGFKTTGPGTYEFDDFVSQGEWHLSDLEVDVDSGRVIEVRTSAPSGRDATVFATTVNQTTIVAEPSGPVGDSHPATEQVTDVSVTPAPVNPSEVGEAADGTRQQDDQTRIHVAAGSRVQDLTVEVPAQPPAAKRTRPKLTPRLVALKSKVQHALDIYFTKLANTEKHGPWSIMHTVIAYGVNTEIYVGDRGNHRANAIGWMCYNRKGLGLNLFYPSDQGFKTREGPGLQGHGGQFLAVLAQSKVPIDYPIKVQGRDFSIADLVEYEKRTCRTGSELTFQLIGLSHYLPSHATWKNEMGDTWDIQRLIREELAQPVRGAACGGTHRMMGFGYAIYKRRKRKEPLTGEWERASKYVEDFQKYAFSLQNRNGSLSTNWFNGPGRSRSVKLQLETTGHTLEWLVFSLPAERLRDARVVKAVDFLTELLLDNRRRNLSVGPRGHALHALAIFDHRVFGTPYGRRRLDVVNHQSIRASR